MKEVGKKHILHILMKEVGKKTHFAHFAHFDEGGGQKLLVHVTAA